MEFWNVANARVDNKSLSHSDNHKNNFLILGPIYDFKWSFPWPEKTFNINFTKATVLYIVMLIIVICL